MLIYNEKLFGENISRDIIIILFRLLPKVLPTVHPGPQSGFREYFKPPEVLAPVASCRARSAGETVSGISLIIRLACCIGMFLLQFYVSITINKICAVLD